MSSAKPSVIIVGGGIGGLFAARAMIAKGLKVTVYEQASQLGEVGAGVIVTPNSARHLERLGLKPALEKYGARFGGGSHYWRDDGSSIAPVQVTDSSGGSAVYGMHRADFVAFLSEGLPPDVVKPGHKCTGFTQDGDVARVTLRQWRHCGSRRCYRRGRHPLGVAAVGLSALQARVRRLGRLSRTCAARARTAMAE